jgi:hypothetical protein
MPEMPDGESWAVTELSMPSWARPSARSGWWNWPPLPLLLAGLQPRVDPERTGLAPWQGPAQRSPLVARLTRTVTGRRGLMRAFEGPCVSDTRAQH